MPKSTTTLDLDPLADYLTVLFVGLQLTHQIEWPWWCVLSPFWAGRILTAAAEYHMLRVATDTEKAHEAPIRAIYEHARKKPMEPDSSPATIMLGTIESAICDNSFLHAEAQFLGSTFHVYFLRVKTANGMAYGSWKPAYTEEFAHLLDLTDHTKLATVQLPDYPGDFVAYMHPIGSD